MLLWGGGFSPQKIFGFSGLKTHVFKFRGTLSLPNVFFSMVDATSSDRTILIIALPPVVIAQPEYSFTSAVNAFQQAPTLQGRKLVIGWKTSGLHKALLDVVELPPYSLRLSQKIASCFTMWYVSCALASSSQTSTHCIICVHTQLLNPTLHAKCFPLLSDLGTSKLNFPGLQVLAKMYM